MCKYNVGIDWADDHHDISIVDTNGKEVKRIRIAHSQQGLEELVDHIQSLKVPSEEVGFVIEANYGLVVQFLIDRGYHVYLIHPKSAERYRDRHASSNKKDDGLDAFVLADALRTDGHRMQELVPDSDLARELKMLVCDRESVVRMQSKVINQLTSCLKSYYPVALKIFSDLKNHITLEFLKSYPTPDALEKMTIKGFNQLLNRHHYPWKLVNKTPKSFFAEIQSQKPFMQADAVVVKAKSYWMESLVEQLETLVAQVKKYDAAIKKLMKQHPDQDIFNSLPGAGETLSSKLAAHFGQNRKRFTTFTSVQRLAGTAPITRESGHYKHVVMRWSCQKQFRNALVQYAYCSLNHSLWAKRYYDDLRKRQKTHQMALRSLANKWVKIIFSLWKNEVSYQEELFLASREKHALLNVS